MNNDVLFVLIVGGLGLLYALKTLFKRMIDPTVVTTFAREEAAQPAAES